MVKEEGGKRAAILERRGPPPLAKSISEEKRMRTHFVMPDGTPLFDRGTLLETIERYAETRESYRGYFR